jgi:hypothetical protein
MDGETLPPCRRNGLPWLVTVESVEVMMLVGRLRASLSLGFLGSLVLVPVASAQQMPCANEIMPLRQAVEKEGTAVKAAVEKKADRAVVCTQLKKFVATEAKFVTYLDTNQGWCGVPPEVVKQVKAGHSHSVKMRNQACAAGPMGAQKGPPPGPGLSEALGTARATGPSNTTSKSSGHPFDTLSGSAIQR